MAEAYPEPLALQPENHIDVEFVRCEQDDGSDDWFLIVKSEGKLREITLGGKFDRERLATLGPKAGETLRIVTGSPRPGMKEGIVFPPDSSFSCPSRKRRKVAFAIEDDDS